MKKCSVLVLALLLAFYSQPAFAKPKTVYRAFAPTEAGKSVMLKSNSKQYKYFELQRGSSMSFEVTGPTKVKIRTRAILPSNASAGQYNIAVWEGTKIRAGRKAEVSQSKVIIENVVSRIGTARDVIIKVPKGKHGYIVTFQSDSVDKLLLRFYQQKKSKKESAYEAFFPFEYARREKLVCGKSRLSYYFIDENGGAKLKVIGPTKIKVYCRANFDPTVKEKSKFTLGVFERDKSVKMFSAVADKSAKCVYPAVPELIPSTVHSFTLTVPDGEHIYDFKKLNSSPPSLSTRFAIPKISLGKAK